MSYERTNPVPTSPQKDNRSVVYGVLIALLLGTWGYIIYDNSKKSEEKTTMQKQYVTVDSSRNEVQQLYNSSLARLDSLTGTNQQLSDSLQNKNGQLSQRSRDISKLKNDIRSILGKNNATTAELARAKTMIGQLNEKIEGLAADVDRLQGENTQLVAKNDKIIVEKRVVEKTLATSDSVKKHLEDVGSTLHVSAINITPIHERSGGKEKETTKAKRVDKLRISFNLDDNMIATNGAKDLYVIIYGPDNIPITIPAYGSGTFSTRDAGEKPFTNKVSVNFEQGKTTPVSFDWKQDQKFQTGDYKIEVYNNGFKIGGGTKTLKKGGLFG